MTNVARSALRSVQSVLVDLVVRSYEKGCVRVRKHAYIVDQHQDKNESHLIYSHPLFVCVAERTLAHSNQPFRELKVLKMPRKASHVQDQPGQQE